ncbi:hypothetical protein [Zavarzinia sp.]|uniref:hypothetical protein n=1 Tax=Zavarzinia sp. TaxID=2027920 RepID=UPI003BB5CC19|nr:hypothetical protein [Zavarzinia sp.]
MKSPTQAHRDARKFNSTLHLAGANAGKTGDLVRAAGRVIHHRMVLGTRAMMSPADADHAEFSRMIPEKIGAFSEAAQIWLRWSGLIADQVSGYIRREIAAANDIAAASAVSGSPVGLAALQQQAASDWMGRAYSQGLALGALMMRSQDAIMAPVLRTAEANARRLGR